jgi:hypothetical protein
MCQRSALILSPRADAANTDTAHYKSGIGNGVFGGVSDANAQVSSLFGNDRTAQLSHDAHPLGVWIIQREFFSSEEVR